MKLHEVKEPTTVDGVPIQVISVSSWEIAKWIEKYCRVPDQVALEVAKEKGLDPSKAYFMRTLEDGREFVFIAGDERKQRERRRHFE